MKQNSLEQRSMDGYEKTEAGQTVRKQVELVVIGGGSAGLAARRRDDCVAQVELRQTKLRFGHALACATLTEPMALFACQALCGGSTGRGLRHAGTGGLPTRAGLLIACLGVVELLLGDGALGEQGVETLIVAARIVHAFLRLGYAGVGHLHARTGHTDVALRGAHAGRNGSAAALLTFQACLSLNPGASRLHACSPCKFF